MDKLEILNGYGFYREAPDPLKKEIAEVATAVSLKPQVRFFDKGMTCGHVGLVGRGSVRVFIASQTGREVTLYTVAPGETCPVNLMSVLLGVSVPATAVAEGPLEAVVLPTPLFRRWVDDHKVVRQFVLEAMAVRLTDIMSLVQEITFGKLDQRLAEFLLRRFGESTEPPAQILMTHEQIAVALSTVREVISRLLREFERTGAVRLSRGCVAAGDLGVLREFASGQPRSAVAGDAQKPRNLSG